MKNQKIETTLTPDQVFDLLSKCSKDENLKVEFSIRVTPQKQKLTITEAMELVDCSRDTLTRAIAKGVIKKTQKLIGRNMFDREELLFVWKNGLL